MTIRRLPAIKSQSSISIPAAYHFYYQPGQGQGQGGLTGEQGQSQGQSQPGFYQHLQQGSNSSASFRDQGGGQPVTRSGRAVGPGHYHRTLSSSSLLSNKGAAVSKSRSDYCAVGVGGGLPSSQNFKERSIVGSGSSGNIDHHFSNGPEFGGESLFFGESTHTKCVTFGVRKVRVLKCVQVSLPEE